MRTAVENPFVPGSDTIPEVWAGRTSQVGDFENVVRPRRMAGLSERGRTILGEPGLGKSTLVRRLAERARRNHGDWTTAQLRMPVGADPLQIVATALLGLAADAGLAAATEKRLRTLIDRVKAISVAGWGLTLEPTAGPQPFVALTDLLIEIGLAAHEQKRLVMIHVDEVQNITDQAALSQLLVCLGDALTYEHTVVVPGGAHIDRVLPVAVYLTGLPDFDDMAGARKGATFTRRFKTITLAPISDDDFKLALTSFLDPGWPVEVDGLPATVRMTQEARDAIVACCCGEPFLFQLAGQEAWYASPDSPLITVDDVRQGWEEAKPEAVTHVERILGRLPEREQQLIRAMSLLDPQERTASAIAARMGFDSATQIGPFASRLDTVRGIINRGKPYSFRHRAIEAYLTTEWPHI
ncbi:ATP-binding protein [Aeromicrobium fastidiosum]|uniref:ATP-binding protein n=1 Tax=Aeromicrobium fastidiosum TaxID=52699 RepID=A0A641AMI0_9ACTN|nr:ATP-binding protein [Aeromicrobium fastidiosum]KAA1374931.1 ATP-binding protein [Aeromicrobium fastidiosum]MBP2390496.1 hypothetical protein [Aeromicrobium fastidiosum]